MVRHTTLQQLISLPDRFGRFLLMMADDLMFFCMCVFLPPSRFIHGTQSVFPPPYFLMKLLCVPGFGRLTEAIGFFFDS